VVLTLAQAVDEALVKNDRLVDQRDGIHRPTLVRGRSSIAIDREVEVAQLRYDTGLSNNLDVVSAESRLMLAESRRIQALADAAVARLRLRALLGVFDPHADIP
jgi:outer membrane protein TolC